MIKGSIVFSLLLTLTITSAQKLETIQKLLPTTFGVGLGLPYGGLVGIRFGKDISQNIAANGALGYHVADPRFNFGIQYSFNTKRRSQFYGIGMYGTNTAIKVINRMEYNRTFTGVSFGLGAKFHNKVNLGNYLDLCLLVPIRSQKFRDQYDTIQNDPFVSDLTSPWPVLIVVGYNFVWF